MDVIEETFRKYGYHSSDLKSGSHKYIITQCEGCGEIRDTQKRHEDTLCRKCSQTAQKPSKKTVILTGDWHIGAGSVDFDELKYVAKRYWKGHPVILLGDLVDMGIDRGMEFSNKMQPQEQMDKLEEMEGLIDTRGYCIGNHDVRIFKKTGLNPYKQIFKQNPSHEFEMDGRIIYFNHGKSVAQNPYGEHLNYAKWAIGDVIALGHSHVLGYLPVMRYNKLNFYVRTGSFLGAEDYAVENGYQPLIKGWAEYDTKTNRIYLKMLQGKEAIDI